MDAERTRLTVDLDSRAEPIHGQILDSGGGAHEFSGYMGLIEALERLRGSSREGASVAGDWRTGIRAEGRT